LQTNQFNRTKDFASEAHQLIDRIVQNNRVYEENCVKFFGITSSQGGTILSIPLNGALKMIELSNVVGVDTSTMTRMVDQLVDKGLVLRKPGDKDRRLVQIGLTTKGQKLNQELASALNNFYKDSLDQIPEKEQDIILESLLKVNEAISQGLEECCKRYCQS
jgi:DNA-binding MarR family transcriptional regulator